MLSYIMLYFTLYQTMPCVVFAGKIQYFVPLVITAADKIMYLEQFCYKISEG